MTTIAFERSGGLVGDEIHFDVKVNELPDDEAKSLMRMIVEADFFNIPENLAGRSTPDEFQYTISVQTAGTKHTVYASDTTIPRSLTRLVKELTVLKMLEYDGP